MAVDMCVYFKLSTIPNILKVKIKNQRKKNSFCNLINYYIISTNGNKWDWLVSFYLVNLLIKDTLTNEILIKNPIFIVPP